MAELQFRVDEHALDIIRNTKLEANFSEMEKGLTEFVAPYEKLIVSEDAVGLAKGDRAKLRSIANHIDSYRKSVKNLYTAPLKEFEEKCKRLNAIIDRGVVNLDAQVKAYEQKRRDEKLFLVREYFETQQKSMRYPGYISWEVIQNPKWGNATYSMDDCKKDVDIAVMGTDRDVQQIIDLSSEFQLSLLDEYRRTHNVFDVFHLQERLAAQKKQEMERLERERQRQEALARQAEATKQKAEAPVAEEAYAPITEDVDMPAPEEPKEEPKFLTTIQILGTAREVSALENLLKTLKVQYHFVSTTPAGE